MPMTKAQRREYKAWLGYRRGSTRRAKAPPAPAPTPRKPNSPRGVLEWIRRMLGL
ncbi:MAG TPA: hypothetical protein VMY35_19545 [Phycisphaerae bacterium]|nr:hypothetical protein [Phycisphaerae bacterium]